MQFVNDIAIPYDGGDCLRWPYATSGDGRARMMIGGRSVGVARYVCAANHGQPPTPEHEAAHLCGKGHEGCVNPNHLVWKTHIENEADKIRHETINRGERCGTAKLTKGDVRSIRLRLYEVSANALAKEYGVSARTIIRIRDKETWAWLD